MKHVEQFSDINKPCNVASCWINSYSEILLGARPILHISRIRVNGIVHSHRKTEIVLPPLPRTLHEMHVAQ
jgi:hypothetical protein